MAYNARGKSLLKVSRTYRLPLLMWKSGECDTKGHHFTYWRKWSHGQRWRKINFECWFRTTSSSPHSLATSCPHMYGCSIVWMCWRENTRSHNSIVSTKRNLRTKFDRRLKSPWSRLDRMPLENTRSWTDRTCIISSVVMSKLEQCYSCLIMNFIRVPRHCT